ncbi:hypothetical protein Bca52824_035597 [Brassica carinata]|uniref:Uncharacterized protein n=1 Tax=Brassica carinata TaxID=52824 RepID=A0A8X7S5N3_BRACI|nr:hypothetical protein Bca52824_035597 [Brassica carinata]
MLLYTGNCDSRLHFAWAYSEIFAKNEERINLQTQQLLGSSNKSVYRVSAHAVTVSFSWNSELSVLLDSTTPFDEDRFRFHSYEEFEANCDLKGDLYGKLSNPPQHL